MPSPVNMFNRVQQWATFGRQWWLFDAYGQDPFYTATYLRPYLMGKFKPIYHAMSDCGDHVVVMNSKYIAMPEDKWELIEYYHDTGYAKGRTWTPAWKLHQEDPTEIFRRTLRKKIKTNKLKTAITSRCHIYPDTDIPEDVMKNISGQIRQLIPLHKGLGDYTQEERDSFPRVLQLPKDFVAEPNNWYQPKHRLIASGMSPEEADKLIIKDPHPRTFKQQVTPRRANRSILKPARKWLDSGSPEIAPKPYDTYES
ncbi:putative 39S ribosomal protein L13, mitochondrial [Hypsibius exemplaris]|uniref:Large ribosomal subunit protein uL13m n=1 Tax=Hypsibius exemplaris TaxID=2072580 RepID=A0A1W0WTP5_HYPEX|nr:putative 39S ribosomal protein L13, mitochondrial [Hypsibius exemplaris]